jgi:hypothetical protein
VNVVGAGWVAARLTVAFTVHVPSAVAGSGMTLSVRGVGPVALLAGFEAVPLLSVQLSDVTATVTSSLAVLPSELVWSSVTVIVIADGEENDADTLHL